LVAACLAPRPEDRPLHAGALAQALRAWIAGDPSPARVMAPTAAHAAVDTAAVTQPLAISAATAAPPPSNVPTRAARPSRRALLIGLAAVLLAVGVAIAIVSLDGLPAAAEEEQSATPILSPVVETPPVELAGWARKLQEDYEEDCGTRFDPALIVGMNKQEAESTVDSLREACEEADD
ncbi:MAG: hypothetical protein ACXWWO_03675, partial [Candidatus Limnocylindria bacterium]